MLSSSLQIIRNLAVIICLLVFTACNFNKQIVRPEKMPKKINELIVKTPTDTFTVHIPGNGGHIIFTKTNNDTADLGYTIENVYFKNNKGDTLNGWLLKPAHQAPAITLLHLHGNGGYLLSQLSYISSLAKNGLQVFMFDYSGFGFSQGHASRTQLLPDALAALDYVKGRNDVKNTRLIIYGQSLGGHFSTVLATKRQQDIDGLVTEGAFTSFKDMAGHRVPVLGRILMKQGYKADQIIKSFHKPLLVIHSKEDKTIPFSMGKRIFSNANMPKEFYEIKQCHICGPIYYGPDIAEKIRKLPNK